MTSATPARATAPSLGRRLLGDKPHVFLACLFVWTITNVDQSLFGYAIPGILAEFHLPLEAAGTILTISFIVSAVLIVLSGLAADRWGRGPMLAILLASSALCVGLQGLAGGIVLLTLFRAFGFGLSGGLSPITNALVVENSDDRLRGVSVGLLQCGYPLGWLLASIVAAPLLANYGWRATCLVAFAVIPIALIIGRLFSKDRARQKTVASATPSPTFREAFATIFGPELRGRSIATIAMFFLFGGAYAGSAFFFPTYFATERHYTPAAAASIVGMSNGIAVFGYIAAALVGEFLIARRNVFILWCLGGAAALLGLLWLSTSPTQDVIWFSLMAALFFGSQAVVVVFVAEIFPPEVRTTALATCGSAPLSLGFALFPLIVPAVITHLGWAQGLSVVVVPLLIASAGAAWFLPILRPDIAETRILVTAHGNE